MPDDANDRRRQGSRPRFVHTRPSILDPDLESEPRIDLCPSTHSLVLFLHNRPIAVIAGTALEYAGLSTHLHRIRHRNPRQH